MHEKPLDSHQAEFSSFTPFLLPSTPVMGLLGSSSPRSPSSTTQYGGGTEFPPNAFTACKHARAHVGMCLLFSVAEFSKACPPNNWVALLIHSVFIFPALKIPGRGETTCLLISGHGSDQRLAAVKGLSSGLPKCPLSAGRPCPPCGWPCAGRSLPPPPSLGPTAPRRRQGHCLPTDEQAYLGS